MGWRKTGAFLTPEEILVMTCDVCERDIGYEDGRRPRPHYAITRLPNPGAIDQQAPAGLVCSPECLRAFAAKVSSDPGGLAPREAGSGSPAKPPK
jgi:hypothetical protein